MRLVRTISAVKVSLKVGNENTALYFMKQLKDGKINHHGGNCSRKLIEDGRIEFHFLGFSKNSYIFELQQTSAYVEIKREL